MEIVPQVQKNPPAVAGGGLGLTVVDSGYPVATSGVRSYRDDQLLSRPVEVVVVVNKRPIVLSWCGFRTYTDYDTRV